jgi:hypothetical protein
VEHKAPATTSVVAGASVTARAHNRDRTGDLILTKDVLYRLSYVSDLHEALATPKDYARRHTLSVDEFRSIGNPCPPRNHHRSTPITVTPIPNDKPPDPEQKGCGGLIDMT